MYQGARRRIRGSQEESRDEKSDDRDRRLRDQARVHRSLEDRVRGEAGDDALEQLLREEGQRRQKRERPGGEPALQAAGEPEHERDQDEADAEREELRREREVSVDPGVLPADPDDGVSGRVAGEATDRSDRDGEGEQAAVPHDTGRVGDRTAARAGEGYAPSAMVRARRLAPLVLALLLPVAGTARADADPASDVLYVRDVFLPLGATVTPELAQQLQDATRAARSAGKPVKVALIAQPTDLGGVPSLFGKPVYYARFLGAELQFLYRGKVLVVMPQGAGLSEGGRLVADAAVVDARIGPGADGLARTAIDLVGQIALGKHAATRSGVGSASGGGLPAWGWIVIAGAPAALIAAGLLLLLRARRGKLRGSAGPGREGA